MTSGPGRTARLVPLAVSIVMVCGILLWLMWRSPRGNVLFGDVGGIVTSFMAIWACRRIGRSSPFWRLWAWSAAALLLCPVAALVCAIRHDHGMPWYQAVPSMLSPAVGMLAFRHIPLDQRTRTDWARLTLDGLAVAVSGAVFFEYVLLDGSVVTTSAAARAAAVFVGVGCLLALVVFGRATISPQSTVDTGALALLSVAPVVGLIAVVLFLGGTALGMLLLSVLGYPLVALMMCAAAYRQAAVDAGTARPWRRHQRGPLADPVQYLAVSLAAALVIVTSAQKLDSRDRSVVAGAVLIATILVVRQLLTVRENRAALAAIRKQQAELERLALSDTLTGLPSRTAFGVELSAHLDRKQPTAVLMIDIDDFKMINDTLGPTAADRTLREIAERLREACGPHEAVARLGGDLFGLLLPCTETSETAAAARRVQLAVSEPIRAREQELMLHASIGIATAADGEDADEVLRNADIAMHAAKDAGKATFVQYEPRMRHDMTEHARMAGELRAGISRGELRLLYQPVYDLRTDRMHSAEALVRWKHPDRGMVSPAEFIPVAERSGLIVSLGAWVLREACRQLAAWRAERGAAAIEVINVNVAVRQLREATFADDVAAALAENGLEPADLIVEITESAVIDGPQVRQNLHLLHDMGIRLALDDFGTGQSSLSLLRSFPVDVIKLDKSFVDGIAADTDRGRQAIAAAVAQLAESLGLKAVAEGIETPDQLCRLRDMGFQYGQGFLLAKPLPPNECGDLMIASSAITARR